MLAVTRALRFGDWRNSGCGLSGSAGRPGPEPVPKMRIELAREYADHPLLRRVSAHFDVQLQMIQTHVVQYINTTNGEYATSYAACTSIQAACFDNICQFPKLLILYSCTTDGMSA